MGLILHFILFFQVYAACNFTWGADRTVFVASDGSGNCTTVQSAINLLPAAYRNRYTIFISPGVYYEKLRINGDAPPVTLSSTKDAINKDDVLLTYDDSEYIDPTPDCKTSTVGEWDSQTLWIGSDDFVAINISIRNNGCNYTK